MSDYKVLYVKPISFKAACDYITQTHRHHKPPQGHKFSIGLFQGNDMVGCAVVGRPIARRLDNGWTAEVTRLCTSGVKNGCSMLYAACANASKGMGYKRIVTYILDSETGTSLKASGWVMTAISPGVSWSVPSRPRDDKHPLGEKQRWERQLGVVPKAEDLFNDA